MKKTISVLALIVSACASVTPQPYTTQQGKLGYTLSCSEFNTSQQQCQAKAGAMCAAGYVVDTQRSSHETFPDSGDGIYRPANNHLAVICKDTPH
ncbi:hypothetical protein [Methylophilus medardicus]|uniref:Lipoprotein n=1 Tax=Methylophilus medardicus TaxID=2588534 RepID=A0A5B8CRU6_9PROT|nr:hypothetical protein [Methylophilus medardicus]QDC43899.1 hypothetical protein FIU01_04755 [Methylophilus medardicus]QDC48906.1 hypothetical protein FIU00_04755 [Methylophilus medardicus]QDC52611.1 hypothetical protein FIT99_04755 [Methylophilus medardicus]